ncbi:hypothetical protein [Streptomyces gilvosporeus]|uniref:Uncharacterized protein n=1 Tax=Streptomyces gilvosporeus TaxID=553510 RepID=A0A1V0TZP6_9ACTN|nr:hypothetical protein [Streptomyces gilvosporeus]ARF58152.1 hypothetical protein B1H19_31770 [Streptomyces gilvosporeus]
MSDFQERRPLHRPVDTGVPAEVHQVVFRWDGNQGRQGTGMKAVAHSCAAERAEELGRELGPLLWVSGAAAPRPSVVRTVSRDGEVMLVQRWPTTDRGGRPSTVSHVLIGGAGTLKTRQCLGLAYGGWGHRESAEEATGELRPVKCADLDALARRWLPEMTERLPTVRHPLILVTAEWLRDPSRRISLLMDEAEPPDRPGRDPAPLVYLGLFLLFGSWLGHEWTFATYDTVDTHPLRLMCVPRWEPDAGGPGPLARVVVRRPAEPQFAHRAANRLVEHLLAHPEDDPGVPQLVGRLKDGAGLDWARRRVLLKEVLDADHRAVAASPAAPPRRPDPERQPSPPPADPPEERWPAPPPEPVLPAPMAAPVAPSPPVAPAPEPEPPAPEPEPPAPAPEPEPPLTPPRPPHPSLLPSARPSPTWEPAPDTGPPAAPDDARALHGDLCLYRRGDVTQRRLLAERLRALSDDLLLAELRSGELTPDSEELLLDELGDERRVEVRPMAMRHELCTEVLRNGRYFTLNGQGAGLASRTAPAGRAADLFGWAVAPVAGHESHLREVQELLHRMCLDRRPAASDWLWDSVIAPRNGRAPDFPPALWQQILRDVIRRRETEPPAAPRPVHADPAPIAPSGPLATAPEPPAFPSRFGELTNNPGCVVGAFLVVIVVLIALVVIFV